MSIWHRLFPSEPTTKTEELSSIHHRLQSELPELAEKDHVAIACLAGLLARVAFADLEIADNELRSITQALTDTFDYPGPVAQKIARIAQEEICELVDHEHHLYTRPINQLFDQEQKANVLKLLFGVAAADGRVENLESEEIRRISKELRLSHEQFVQAKLTVKDRIQALRS